MVARINTLAFQGMNAVKVDVQVHLSPGKMVFNTVGLPDKAIGESRERVRSALSAIGLGLPPERITVNLAPADLPKEGSHYDLPIALGLMVAMGALPAEANEAISSKLTARGYNRIIRVARTIADLDGCEHLAARHIASDMVWRGVTSDVKG